MSVSTIHGMWRSGRMPQPFNASAAKGYRWALSTIEAYEQQAVGA